MFKDILEFFIRLSIFLAGCFLISLCTYIMLSLPLSLLVAGILGFIWGVISSRTFLILD